MQVQDTTEPGSTWYDQILLKQHDIVKEREALAKERVALNQVRKALEVTVSEYVRARMSWPFAVACVVLVILFDLIF